MRKRKTKNKLGILAGVCLLLAGLSSGCSGIGNAPAGASIAEVKAKFDARPIEERAKEINQMSIPAGNKQRTIQQMYAKEGKTPPPELLNPSGPQSNAPVTSH